jgi:hypothetical protein
MTTLVSALYTEGPTDEKFLPIVIQRTIQQILIERGRMTVDILEPILERLSRVPAYQQFVGEMTNTLIALHLAN